MIPLSVPNIKGNEKKYINECIDTEWVSSVGSYVNLFEEKIKDYTGSKYAVACSSGTSALQLALLSIGSEKEDEVIVPTMTFIATPNSVIYNQLHPIFMDCDEFLNIDLEKLKLFFDKNTYMKNGYCYNSNSNRRIFAIMPVHVSGNAVDIEKLQNICKDKNVKIVEDAAEAMGTKYNKGKLKGKHTGTIGDIGCLSFNGNKIMTTGGGGMIITDSKKYADKARYLSTQANDDSMRYIHHEIGYNYRLTNVQAALGVGQLEQLNEFVSKKIYINNFYRDTLKNSENFSILDSPDYANNNHWMTSIVIRNNHLNLNELLDNFTLNKIQVRPMWHLCHLQKPYIDKENFMIEKAITMQKKVINIPCSTNISDNDLDKVSDVILNL